MYTAPIWPKPRSDGYFHRNYQQWYRPWYFILPGIHFLCKKKDTFELGCQLDWSLAAADAAGRVGGCGALVGGYVLPEGLADKKGSGENLLLLGTMVVGKVGDELVLDLGIVVGGLEGAWQIIGKFDGKRVGILPFFESLVVVLLEQVLHGIEGIVACEFGPVGWAALKPLAPLLSYVKMGVP